MFSFPPFTVSPVQVPLQTPPFEVASDVQVPVELPQSWLPYIVTALATLQQPATWQGDDATRIEAIEQATELIDRIANASIEEARPFFDTPEDADKSPVDDLPQPYWYEPIGDWIITGFIAAAATPGAAIVYSVTIPRLRLAFRANNIGAAFKILLNGLEVATGDTYSPIEKVIDFAVDAQSFATEHGLGNPPWQLTIQKVA